MALTQTSNQDATGNTSVIGTVSTNQAGTWNIQNISGTISLPTGAATAAKQPALGVAGTASTDVITIQGIASMVALKVDGSAVVQPISGTVTVTQATGTSLHAVIDSGAITANIGTTNGIALDATVANVQGSVAAGAAASKSTLIGGQFNTTLPTLTAGQQAALQVDSSARQIISPLTNSSVVKAQLQDNTGAAITLGSKVSASSVPVVIASDQTVPVSGTVTANAGTGNFTVTQATGTNLHVVVDSGTISTTALVASTGTVSSVASSATSSTMLASNAARKGFSFYNDSTSVSYAAFSATTSTSAFSIKMQPNSYYENDVLYTGVISVIWASANGFMRVTEFS